MGGVLKTGRGDKEMEVAVVGSMRWRMPRAGVVLAPVENFFALLDGELSPDVMRRGHGQGYGVPALAGGFVTMSRGLKYFDEIVFAGD